MNTKVIFNTDKKLKDAAMKKARKEGITYSAFLNIATRMFVKDELEVDIIARDISEARKGKSIPAKVVYKKLGIKI